MRCVGVGVCGGGGGGGGGDVTGYWSDTSKKTERKALNQTKLWMIA